MTSDIYNYVGVDGARGDGWNEGINSCTYIKLHGVNIGLLISCSII